MNNTKQWYLSRTVWGGLVAVAASLLQATGITIDSAAQGTMADDLAALAGAVGGLVAIYGRIAAEHRLG